MYMAIMLRELYSDVYDMIFVFANTGCEHEDTLRFLHDAETILNMPIVWVEGKVQHGQRKSTRHTVVCYEIASRNGEPFEEVIKKYGIPNNKSSYCTREMKLNAIKSYCRSIGWKKADYETAIGIRTDENRRVVVKATEDKIIYPLIDLFPTDKDEVLEYMAQFDWDLNIPEHLGNCVMCFKKSYKKLNKVYLETPEVFNFTDRMEESYPRVGAFQKKHRDAGNPIPPQVFFRGGYSTQKIFKLFDMGMIPTGHADKDDGGCSESCEMYETEVVK